MCPTSQVPKKITPRRLLSAIVNSLYSFWWDIANDWGLPIMQWRVGESSWHGWEDLPPHTHAPEDPRPERSRKSFHRTLLLFRSPLPYHSAIIINFILRLTWSAKLSPHLHRAAENELGVFVLEILEISRRWLWVYFRVEFETIKISSTGPRQRPEASEAAEPFEMQRLPL